MVMAIAIIRDKAIAIIVSAEAIAKSIAIATRI